MADDRTLIAEAREALARFCNGKQRMRIPANQADDDLRIYAALDRFEALSSRFYEDLREARPVPGGWKYRQEWLAELAAKDKRIAELEGLVEHLTAEVAPYRELKNARIRAALSAPSGDPASCSHDWEHHQVDPTTGEKSFDSCGRCGYTRTAPPAEPMVRVDVEANGVVTRGVPIVVTENVPPGNVFILGETKTEEWVTCDGNHTRHARDGLGVKCQNPKPAEQTEATPYECPAELQHQCCFAVPFIEVDGRRVGPNMWRHLSAQLAAANARIAELLDRRDRALSALKCVEPGGLMSPGVLGSVRAAIQWLEGGGA